MSRAPASEAPPAGGSAPPPGGSLDEVALARGWVEWLVETRDGYADALLRMPEADRTKDRGASFPSVQDIFLHIVDNNVWWFESVPQNRQEAHQKIHGPLPPDAVRAQVDRVDRIGRALAASLTPDRLTESFTVRGVQGDGRPFEMQVNLRTIIWHMVEEELQHRGELNALLWQMDLEAPTRAWFSSPLAE